MFLVVVTWVGAAGTIAALIANSAELTENPIMFLALTLNLYVKTGVAPLYVNDFVVTPD